MFALLRQGVIAGALAGLLAGLVAFAIGEPALQRAIDRESAAVARTSTASPAGDHHHAADRGGADDATEPHAHADDALVSRPWQRAGLFLASTLSGGVLGGLLALAFVVRRARRPHEDPWFGALWLGAAATLAWVLFPLVLAPANPPTVGDPDTVTQRTLAYLGAVGGGLAFAWLASRIVRARPAEAPRWQPVLLAVATLSAGLVVLWLVLPAPAAAPAGFPADLLWRFRLASVATQLTLWGALTVGFAALVDARPRHPAASTSRAAAAAA